MDQADLPSSSAGGVPLVKATQVTTRTELTKEDKENKSTTSQIQEKTFTATTTKTGNGHTCENLGKNDDAMPLVILRWPSRATGCNAGSENGNHSDQY